MIDPKHILDDDGYWLECVTRSGSNSVVNGFQDMVDYINSGRADQRTLLGMMCALRSLSQECQRQYSALREKENLRRYG